MDNETKYDKKGAANVLRRVLELGDIELEQTTKLRLGDTELVVDLLGQIHASQEIGVRGERWLVTAKVWFESQEGVYKMQCTAFLRDVVGWQPAASGNLTLGEYDPAELFRRVYPNVEEIPHEVAIAALGVFECLETALVD